ncbi:aldehyde dehydrogenase family protein [Cupriavidus agavae]|uniref:aldehyde dehydrogenase (NAD(+)) n=1 Tax=Cupriavidus agavae TaxID=1001822 RepID=A0A4Q7S7H1_9BURK|nr:aldehyde dehydrogenase family protein [Cupriavidus agavae]RZT42361.1 aldehyde dehydrogenase (NAD+) [Cupriavidus agavae]
MQILNTAYIDGEFVRVQGAETIEIVNPTTGAPLAVVTLANRADARRAIAAARSAQVQLRQTGKAERIDMLRSLQAAVLRYTDAIRDATIEEYGAPVARAQWVSQYASQCFASSADALAGYPLEYRAGTATVLLEPVGVSALIAPWNSTAGTVCSKLASALAAGCATVIKPSELSPLQTQVLCEALHEAGLPPGVFNVLLGRGGDVGAEICANPAVARISFTGSTQTGKTIARSAVDTMKRVTLALSGKSASIVTADADLARVLPMAVSGAFLNNGQACMAGTRLLVPQALMGEVVERVQAIVGALVVGDPRDPATALGPLASQAQFDRVQHFIRRGQEQGAVLVAGGEGKPEGLPERLAGGFFVKPTVFAGVHNDMEIAREEIFGPVLSIIGYDTEDDAVEIANDSPYGLFGYVFSADAQRARGIAERMQAGTILVNRVDPEVLAPFGGVRQSGLGREFGLAGLVSYLEPKTVAAR